MLVLPSPFSLQASGVLGSDYYSAWKTAMDCFPTGPITSVMKKHQHGAPVDQELSVEGRTGLYHFFPLCF